MRLPIRLFGASRPPALRSLIRQEFARTQDAPLVLELHQAAVLALAGRRQVFNPVLSALGRKRLVADPTLLGRLQPMVLRAGRPLWIEGWLGQAEFGLVAAIDDAAPDPAVSPVHLTAWIRESPAAPAIFLPVVATIAADTADGPARLRFWDTAGTRKLLRLHSDSARDRKDYERRATDSLGLAVTTAVGCLTAPIGAVLASAVRNRLPARLMAGERNDDPNNIDAIRETN